MSKIEVTLIDSMGSDLSVVNAARVSFGKQSQWNPNYRDEKPLYEKDERLIRYLAKHEHISPFGHAFASFHVKAPIFVHAQLLKHKFLRANTISRRYVDSDVEFYVPDVWRGRSADKKQGSDGVVNIDSWTLEVADNAYESGGYAGAALGVYNCLLKQGVAPEQARMVLPQSTMTEWYWSGSLDAFASMCKLRLKEDTQYESRLVAQQISAKMAELFPVSWSSLVDEGGNDE